MHLTLNQSEKIINLAQKLQLILIGEIHGVRENPEVVTEIVDSLRNKYKIIVGFEYPQTLVDNQDKVGEVFYKDGRYSKYHEKMLNTFRKNNIKMFGFDLDEKQQHLQATKPIDWRDTVMATNINNQLNKLQPDEKIVIVTGDLHYQTKEITLSVPNKEDKKQNKRYQTMASLLNTNSLLAIHLCYLSGSYYNFKLKDIPAIRGEKDRSFRTLDDFVEIEIKHAHPTDTTEEYYFNHSSKQS